jgi:hypothetical protein
VNLLKHLLLPLCTLLSISNPGTLLTKQEPPFQENIPVATRWLLDAAGESERAAISSVYMILCPKKSSRGTGFFLKGGPIVTVAHAIQGCQASEIIAISPFNEKITFNNIIADPKRDLALLFPSKKLSGGLLLDVDENPCIGVTVSTWGFPDGWSGPAPLLSVGYLSGYMAQKKDVGCESFVKLLVVNGAFNPGNSGGPLFLLNDNKVIGIVVSKLIPLSRSHLSAIEALAKNKSGLIYRAIDEKGNKIVVTESQVVAQVLERFRELTQVMIGQAVHLSEIRAFLREQGIKEPA